MAEAEAMYRDILDSEPQHADALHLLGVLSGQMGRKLDAVDFIRRSISLRPDHAEAHKNLGVALKDSGQIADAIAAYRQAIALQPGYAEAHKNLGSALYQSGLFEDAIAAYREAIALRPDFAEAHSNLGAALRSAGRLEEAVASSRQAIALKPNHPDAHNNLANALHDQRRSKEAIEAYRAALRLRPDLAAGWYNLGIALNATGQYKEAIDAYRKAVEMKPDHAGAFGNLAHALKALGRTDEAIAAYRKAIALNPDSPDWQHVLAALTGEHSPTTTPASYVRSLFDSYAGEFEEHLAGQLHYRVPELLREAIVSLEPDRTFDTLDLGCGTGLCGAQFRPLSRNLTGVDLSPAMIEKANARGIYDRLITGDIAEAMSGQEDKFDLILAGDLFVYVGDLDHVFADAGRTLRNGGLLGFSIERHDGEGYLLHSKVRFAHSLDYIRSLSRKHRLAERHVREITVRKSGADNVAGWLVVLGKPAQRCA